MFLLRAATWISVQKRQSRPALAPTRPCVALARTVRLIRSFPFRCFGPGRRRACTARTLIDCCISAAAGSRRLSRTIPSRGTLNGRCYRPLRPARTAAFAASATPVRRGRRTRRRPPSQR